MNFIFIAMIERKEYTDLLLKWKNKKVIKIITGIRRCGKSTLLSMFRQHLLSSNTTNAQIQDYNFEDIENEPYLDYHVLHQHIKENLQPGQMNYLFLDEIQLVPQFQKAIDSLNLLDNVDIYLTGSNAYLLSGEIATLLSGRYVEIHMLPLSFKEYISTQSLARGINRLYRNYVENGSFPYITQLDNDRELIRDYLSGIYNTIVLKDVVARRNISDVMILESIIRFLTDNIGNLTSIKRISDTMTSFGRKISVHTVENYISALTDSFIFYQANRYDVKGMQHLKTGQKYYLTDMGLRNQIIGSRTNDLGHVLENLIYLELRRRNFEVYVGKTDKTEIDFVAIKDDMKYYYQVSLTVRDQKTLQRELEPLESVTDHFPKYLLTLDDDPVIMHNGIKQIYALDWLLE